MFKKLSPHLLLWTCSALVLLLKYVEAQHSPTGSHEQGALEVQIYIYDLPANFQNLSTLEPHAQSAYNSFLYGAEKRLPEALHEAGYVTTNASQAKFFLVPIWLYAVREHASLQLPAGSPLRPERQALSTTISHISARYPFWSASQGTDHIWTLTNDQGFCGFARNEETLDEIQNSTILTHWGLQTTEVDCGLKERLSSFNHCPDRAKKAGRAEHLTCFDPHKDVVISTTAWDNFEYLPIRDSEHHGTDQQQVASQQRRRLHADDDLITLEAISAKKEHTLFFVGSLRTWATEYSHGVRQTVVALFNDNPGFYLNRMPLSHADMAKEMGRSHFCLATSGAGWGVRLKLAVMTGCIPLVIQDDVQMPFETVLPYKDFALRLPQHAVHDLPRILEELLQKQPQRVQEMRSAATHALE
ncbi:hypothetical protein WJX73_008096 [Symbiochloris irregularis]|uniref:Exostosin GT47 domain-containing protein n=1 Tax=Symbiochloris irregularis TaxID=706552 RepID=A0AAW1PAL8_9CHLO